MNSLGNSLNLSIPFWSDFIEQRARNHSNDIGLSIPFWSDFIMALNSCLLQLHFFQSHFGLILSLAKILGRGVEIDYRFQSHFGLILSKTVELWDESGSGLSIPFWSDFIITSNFMQRGSRLFFQSHFGLILSYHPPKEYKK